MSGSAPEIIKWLFERAFGGREAVAVPGAPIAQLRGPFPAGVQDLLSYLVEEYEVGAPPAEDQWAFLLGAPGNGKSEAMRSLAAELGLAQRPPVPGTKAPRELNDSVGGVRMLLINDASIPRDDRPSEGSLYRDLTDCFADVSRGEPTLLFANVNRGVLVEELAAAGTRAGDNDLAQNCLEWLAEAASGEEADDPATSYYARRRFETAGRAVVVHVLSLDAVSLLEPQPGLGRALDFSSGDDPYVAPYEPVGMLRSPVGTRSESVAGTLIGEVAAEARWASGCDSCGAAPLCPFRANARWLRDDALREHFLEALRAAEVAAGRRLTYRDLMALLATAILGKPEEAWSESHPCDWVGKTANEAENDNGVALGRLVGHRIYASLFPAPKPSAYAWRRLGAGRIAAGDLYNAVLEQFGPGMAAQRPGSFDQAFRVLDPSASVGSWEGKREVTVEAAEAMHVEPPLERLSSLSVIGSAAISDLDIAFDGAVLRYLNENVEGNPRARKDREPQIRRWRATILLRHVGLASGWFTDTTAVEAWLQAQRGTLTRSDPGVLLAGLLRLLVPQSGAIRIAPFRPRTRALSALPSNIIVVTKQSSELHAELRAVKDSLQFVLRVASDRSGRALPVPVDLDIAREAALLGDVGLGFTDLPNHAVARVERVLASLLSRARTGRNRPAVQVTDDDGRLFSLRLLGTTFTLMPMHPGR